MSYGTSPQNRPCTDSSCRWVCMFWRGLVSQLRAGLATSLHQSLSSSRVLLRAVVHSTRSSLVSADSRCLEKTSNSATTISHGVLRYVTHCKLKWQVIISNCDINEFIAIMWHFNENFNIFFLKKQKSHEFLFYIWTVLRFKTFKSINLMSTAIQKFHGYFECLLMSDIILATSCFLKRHYIL